MRNSLLLLGAALVFLGCTPQKSDKNPVTSNPTSIALSVEAQPATIRADGISRMVVFVELQRNEQPVGDSTQVILFHTIGTLGLGTVFTRSGVALDTLTSDTTAGTGWLIAYADGVRDSVEIMFTQVP
jgi:hypothetical protein